MATESPTPYVINRQPLARGRKGDLTTADLSQVDAPWTSDDQRFQRVRSEGGGGVVGADPLLKKERKV